MSPDKTQWGDQFEGHLVPPPISKDDTYFKDVVGVEFVDNKEGIVLKELNDLFEKVGFPKRDLAKLKVALENTYYLVWIRAAKQTRYARQGQMIGFGRATSDGALSATIWDVAISPSWQRSGLGRALIERITARLVQDCIPTITLYAEPNVVSLYEKLGFMKDPEGIKGMAFQRSKKEGGAARPRVAAARG
ncbi:acyl-CoA N-acyltransferase [Haematococcus lacustris]